MHIGDREYFQRTKQQLFGFPEEAQRKALRAATKRVAKHYGLYSRYDGKGNPREGFPPRGPDQGRVINPNRKGTTA